MFARFRMRRGFSLLELLVVFVILAVLMAMLLPAVQKAREAAQRLRCSNNLKQQGVAMQSYHESYRVFPPAYVNGGGNLQSVPKVDFYGSKTFKVLNHTGFTLMLPYIGEDNLYRQYDLAYPSCDAFSNWSGLTSADLAGGGVDNCPGNLEVIGTPVAIYTCPSDADPTVDTVEGDVGMNGIVYNQFVCKNARRSNYLLCIYEGGWDHTNLIGKTGAVSGGYARAAVGVFGANGSARRQDIKDGLSTTIAIGETLQEHFSVPFTESLTIGRQIPHWGAGHALSVTGGMVYLMASTFPLLDMHINCKAGKNQGSLRSFVTLNPRDPEYHKLMHCGYGSKHPGGANFVFADGSVHFLHNNMSNAVYRAMGTIRGGEQIETPE